MEKRYKLEWLGSDYADEDNPLGAWGVYDTLDTDGSFGTETFAIKEFAVEFMDDLNRDWEEMERVHQYERELARKKFEPEHQDDDDDDDISDRDRRADLLYESGYGDQVGLDSFAYDSRGYDTGLRESDFI